MCTLGTPRASSHENTEGVLALPLHNMHSVHRILKLSNFIFFLTYQHSHTLFGTTLQSKLKSKSIVQDEPT